ncbi:hypothetical protein P3T39_004342 [Kitasatospora sp. GP82]|nr:hypothetical protein [Kitasatospora sp. GP82]
MPRGSQSAIFAVRELNFLTRPTDLGTGGGDQTSDDVRT